MSLLDSPVSSLFSSLAPGLFFLDKPSSAELLTLDHNISKGSLGVDLPFVEHILDTPQSNEESILTCRIPLIAGWWLKNGVTQTFTEEFHPQYLYIHIVSFAINILVCATSEPPNNSLWVYNMSIIDKFDQSQNIKGIG